MLNKVRLTKYKPIPSRLSKPAMTLLLHQGQILSRRHSSSTSPKSRRPLQREQEVSEKGKSKDVWYASLHVGQHLAFERRHRVIRRVERGAYLLLLPAGFGFRYVLGNEPRPRLHLWNDFLLGIAIQVRERRENREIQGVRVQREAVLEPAVMEAVLSKSVDSSHWKSAQSQVSYRPVELRYHRRRYSLTVLVSRLV